MSPRLFEMAPDRDAILNIIRAHQWNGYTKDGKFRCKAGCIVEPPTPSERNAFMPSWLEAQHQADMLLSVYTESPSAEL